MRKLMHWMVAGAMVAGVPALWAAEDGGDTEMKKLIVEQRAKRFEDQGGKSDSGKLYIYQSTKDIEKATKEARREGGRNGEDVNIGGTTINKGDKVRSVDVVMETTKEIDVKTNGGDGEVKIGQVNIDPSAVRGRKIDVNVIVDAEEGIKVH